MEIKESQPQGRLILQRGGGGGGVENSGKKTGTGVRGEEYYSELERILGGEGN